MYFYISIYMFCLYDTKMIILPVTDLKPTTGCTQDIDGG